MKTEAESRECRCLQLLNVDGDRCIASKCMAWRLEIRDIAVDYQPPEEWTSEPTGRGYCGMAGRP